MGVYQFVVELKDETSPAAKKAGGALDDLGKRMSEAKDKMAGLDDKMKRAALAFANIEKPTRAQRDAFRQQRVEIMNQRQAWDDHARGIEKQSAAWTSYRDKVKQASEDAKARSMKFQNAIQTGFDRVGALAHGAVGVARQLFHLDFGGAITSVSEKLAGAVQMLDLAVPGLGTALAAVTGILGTVIGGIAGGIKSLMGFALACAEGRERTITLYAALADGQSTGEEVAGMIGKLADKIGWTGGQLKPFAKELMAMGHRTLPDLRQELVAVASAQALMGEGGGQAYMGLATKIEAAVESGNKLKVSSKQLGRSLAEIGLSVGDVADKMGMTGEKLAKALKAGTVEADKFGEAVRQTVTAKGKGALENFRNSLDGIGNRFHSFISRLFAKVDVKPFLDALNEIVDAFGLSTKSGQGMVSSLNSFFVFAGDAVKWLTLAFLDFAIFVLEGAASVKKFFSEAGDGKGMIDTITTSFEGMKAAVEIVTLSLAPLIEGLKLVGKHGSFFKEMGKIALGPLAGGFSGPQVNLGEALDAQAKMKGSVQQAVVAGASFSEGIAQGIEQGEGSVFGVVEALGKKMGLKLKDSIDAHSPSRLTMAIGGMFSQGFARGISGEVPSATHAVRDLSRASVAESVSAGATNAPAGRGGGGRALQVGPFYIQGGDDRRSREIAEEVVELVFEQLELTQGVG